MYDVTARTARRPIALAVDVGSSSVRASLFDADGRPLRGFFAHRPYAMALGGDGSVTVPAGLLLELVAATLDELCAHAASLLPDVVAAGVSCFFHSLVGLRADGDPVTPVRSWADTSASGDATALRRATDADEVWRRTGCPLHASYWPAKIRRLGAAGVTPARWSGFPEVLLGWLTGHAAASRSIASATGLYDRLSDTWDAPLLALLGIDPMALPEVVEDGEDLGRLRPELAARWPVLSHVAWFPAWGDGACGNVGLGCAGPSRAALMIGTSGAIRVLVPGQVAEAPPGCFAYRLHDSTLLGGQLSEGGVVAAWMGRLGRRSLRALESAAAALEPDAHGLTMLPFLAGERGPGYHDEAAGVITGLTLRTDAPALYRATIEAVAFRFAALDARLGAALPAPPAVVASGGALAASPLWVQVLADALGRDVAAASIGEASSRGAALLALHAGGWLADLDAPPAPPARIVTASAAAHARYRGAIDRQAALYEVMLGRSSGA